MKRLLLTLILIHLSIIVYAEETDISIRVDSILNRVRLLEKSEITSLHKKLRKCYAPIKIEKDRISWRYQDSVENVRRMQYSDSILIINRDARTTKQSAKQLANIGRRYYNLSSLMLTDLREHIKRHKEDSLLTLLILNYCKRAYIQSSNTNDKAQALLMLGKTFFVTGDKDNALTLYRHSLQYAHSSDSLRYFNLKGVIECIVPNDITYISYYNAVDVLPYQKEATDILAKMIKSKKDKTIFDLFNLYEEYINLSYISKMASDKTYIDYCRCALSLLEENQSSYLYSDIADLRSLIVLSVFAKNAYKQEHNVILGDYYFLNADYENALMSYMSAYTIDVDKFTNYTIDDIYQKISEFTEFDSPLYKYPDSYIIHAYKLALTYYKLNVDIYRSYLNEAYYYAIKHLLDSFKNGYSVERVKKFMFLNEVITSRYNDTDSRWAYNTSLFIKGVTNNVDIGIRQKHTKADGSLSSEYQQYVQSMQSYQLTPTWENEKKLVKTELELQRGEIGFDQHLKSLKCTHEHIFNSIKGGNKYAIEFVAIPKLAETKVIYSALIMTPNNSTPIKIDLGEESDFISFVKLSSSNEYYRSGYDLIWLKLEPYIKEASDIYFAPDGLLYQMNIEVFQDADGKRANEKWNLHRVSSTRELCMEKPEIDMTSAVLYGNLLYDVDSTTMVTQSRTYRQEDNYVASRGFVQDSTMRNGWNRLVATNTEINSIAMTMQACGIEPTIYKLETGNEESFKALSGKKTPIIHLATHGFFYKDEEAKTKTFFETLDMNKNNYALDNSLKRSGLILAGAQKAWLGEPIPDNVEDGVLLAEEIATMDLTGTDLVVLSACETGLGEITSEGVFGLQRAFKKAGVQTLIMSLWKVDDNATSLFMRTFYKQWLGGKSKHAAFLDAQAAVRECKESDYSNPYYWASFIMLD